MFHVDCECRGLGQTGGCGDSRQRGIRLSLDETVQALAERAGEHDRDAPSARSIRPPPLDRRVNLTCPPRSWRGAGLAASCRVVEAVAMGDASVALVLSQH